MRIDRAAVDHVARLARLDLAPEERERMQAELSHILEHAEKIQALDLDKVEPTSHAIRITNAQRPDEVTPSLPQEVALANAPEVEDGRFKVPRIIEESETAAGDQLGHEGAGGAHTAPGGAEDAG